jgi:hypothetical protein
LPGRFLSTCRDVFFRAFVNEQTRDCILVLISLFFTLTILQRPKNPEKAGNHDFIILVGGYSWDRKKRRISHILTGWVAHKTYVRCVLFGSASSFASTTALARLLEGACGMPPYLSALETRQSKLRTSLRRLCSKSGDLHHNTAKHLCSQSGHSGTHQNIRAANQVREHQTMAPRLLTFRLASLKDHPRLYR